MNTPVARHRSPSSSHISGPAPDGAPPHVVVVGGGIAGLTAAARLGGATGEAGPPARVTLLESRKRLGGKLLRGEVGGVLVDLGAEAVLVRGSATVELARDVGLGHDLEPPSTTDTSLWTRGALHSLPEGQLMGIPGDFDALAASGVLSEEGLVRACRDTQLPPTDVGDDISVGRYVTERMGREVVDRLVEPLLGGVHAGQADLLSLQAVLPRLLGVARGGGPLAEGVRRMQSAAGAGPGERSPVPPFRSLRGGLGRLPLAVARACRTAGVDVRTSTTVRSLRRTDDGWRLTVEDAHGVRQLAADAVVLAVPAPAAAGLLARQAPAAAAELRAVEYADTAVVTLVFDRADLSGELRGSGFLVPPVDGRLVRAATFLSNKWRWHGKYAPEKFVLRTSVGRHGENTAMSLGDGELVARSRAELAAATGLGAVPAATAVTRWESALPQYTVGHGSRTALVREHLGRLGTLAICGAAYDGVGITGCVEGALRAASAITAALQARPR